MLMARRGRSEFFFCISADAKTSHIDQKLRIAATRNMGLRLDILNINFRGARKTLNKTPRGRFLTPRKFARVPTTPAAAAANAAAGKTLARSHPTPRAHARL
jgi:hypothetical protein